MYVERNMGVSKNSGTPKSSILIGFSIIFTIHFGGKHPYFWVDIHIFVWFSFSQPHIPNQMCGAIVQG